MSKRDIRNYCRDNNLLPPRFSGKSKRVFITPQARIKDNTSHLKHLEVISEEMGYTLLYTVVPRKFKRR